MGKSLGIDPLSDSTKICNLNCIYCQLGKTSLLTNERREYVSTWEILDEIQRFFQERAADSADIDYLTFSGRGEPTLAKNLGAMIKGVRRICQEEIAVITNATFLGRPDVQEDLAASDLIITKLDAYDEASFRKVDRGIRGISFEKTLEGIKSFREIYTGTLAIQIMFVEENRTLAEEIAKLVREINPDEIQINTPLRPSGARPLDKAGIDEIKSCFAGMPAVTVYDRERKETVPFDRVQTIKRHGNFYG